MGPSIEDRVRRLEDIEAVRLLMARYHQECDGWDDQGTHKRPESITDLFTEDGVWDIPKPAGATTQAPAVGREQIVALAKELQSIQWIFHFVVNPIVEVDGDTVTGEFKGLVRMQSKQSAPSGWGLGIYRADVARTHQGWKFRSLAWETLSVTGQPPLGPVGQHDLKRTGR